MARTTENKLVLVVRRTRLDELVARFNTHRQAQFYVEHLGADFSDYLHEHETYTVARRLTEALLAQLGRVQVIERSFLPNFIFGHDDVIVALGQDGLVANTLKYTTGQAVIGVNPDPKRWDGVLLPFSPADLSKLLPEVFSRRRRAREVTMAQAVLNDGQSLLAVNDFFIGPKTHVSARYQLRVGENEETHSSSGIIVSTGLGSTGWLKSLIAGATAITGALGQRPLKVEPRRATPWDADYLYFTVREPFPSKTTAATLVFGKVTPEEPMIVTSLMAEHGVIFSDGIEKDFLTFNSGMRAEIKLAAQKGRIVV